MEKNLPFQTIRHLRPLIRVPSRLWAHLRASTDLFGKKWYYSSNPQAIGFLVFFNILVSAKFVFNTLVSENIL